MSKYKVTYTATNYGNPYTYSDELKAANAPSAVQRLLYTFYEKLFSREGQKLQKIEISNIEEPAP